MTHPERLCTRCNLDGTSKTVATVVCTARDGLQWFACEKPEHRLEYEDGTPATTTPIAEWFAQLATAEARSR